MITNIIQLINMKNKRIGSFLKTGKKGYENHDINQKQ